MHLSIQDQCSTFRFLPLSQPVQLVVLVQEQAEVDISKVTLAFLDHSVCRLDCYKVHVHSCQRLKSVESDGGCEDSEALGRKNSQTTSPNIKTDKQSKRGAGKGGGFNVTQRIRFTGRAKLEPGDEPAQREGEAQTT